MPDTTTHILKLGFGDAIEAVEVTVPEGEPRPWDAESPLAVVGAATPRIDGEPRVRGAATYTHDVRLPGMLYAAILRSPHAAAEVESIDVGPALRQPGVKGALALVAEGEVVRFAGADIAAVAATTREAARAALAAIEVRFRARSHVVDLDAAMRPGAALVHEEDVDARRTEGDEPAAGGEVTQVGNIRRMPSQKKGSAAKGMRQARVTHDAVYSTQVQTHAALETHSIVVRWDSPTSMSAWCSTQGIGSVRDELASIFELKPADVRVYAPFVGGGFGAKFGASAVGSRIGFVAGELARQTRAPVAVLLDRHEEHVCTGNRPNSRQRVRLGARKDGALTAIHVSAHGSAGVGTGAGVGSNAFGLYTRCPNILVESHDVFCNTGPSTAMRAPGHPQGGFALELALDELAVKLDRDPVEMRIAHVEHPVRRYQLEVGRDRFAWGRRRREADALAARGARVRRGVGVACAIWGDYGHPAARVTVSVSRDGQIEVRNGVQDIGSGITTVLGMVVAEVLQQPLERVRVRIGDSELGPSVGSGGSQTTSSVAPAARNAAESVKAELTVLAAKLLAARRLEDVAWSREGLSVKGRRHLSFADLCKKIDGEAVVATSTRPMSYSYHPARHLVGPIHQMAGVQFAAVDVDTWTGVVEVREILAIHDAGRIHNPLTCRSQVNGGVILGLSYALMEQRVLDNKHGRMLNPNFEGYKIAGFRDLPKIDVLFTEVYTGANSTGAAGIAEPATIPTAAAIACAVRHAIGAPVRSLPITPDKVLEALASESR